MMLKYYLEVTVVYVAIIIAFIFTGIIYTTETYNESLYVGSRDTGILPITRLPPVEVKPTKEQQQAQIKKALTTKLPAYYRQASKADIKKLVKLVYKETRVRGIDPILMLGLIAAESSFNKNSVSPVGAKGYTQVMSRYHEDKIKGRDLFHPAVNVEVGVKILHNCFKTRKSERMALACYNGARAKSDIDRYVRAVYTHKDKIQRMIKL